MNQLSLLALIEIITTFQLLFFSLFLVTLNKGKKLSNILLGAFLLFLVLSYQSYVLDNFSQFFIANFPTFYHFMPLSVQLLVGPFLYFYVLSFLDSDFKFDLKNALHLVPFALFTLYLAVIFYSLPFEEKQQILRYGSLFSWREYTIFMSIIQVQSILYIVAILIRLKAYRTLLLDHVSELSKHNLSWLMLILIGVGINWMLRITNFWIWVIDDTLFRLDYDQFRYIQAVFFLAFSSTIFFKTLREPDVFYVPRKKYATNRLNDTQSLMLKNKLLEYMDVEKPYLNPELNLKILSDGSGIAQHQISQVLNVTLEKNFFDFVNGYRIMEAKELLMQHSSLSKNISEIMYEVGFNSKSVFNTTFKKMTSMTPTQFRKFKNSA